MTKFRILDRQYSFYKKLCRMTCEDAIVKIMMDAFSDSRWLRYYARLNSNNGKREIKEREERIQALQSSMCKYYCDLQLLNNKADIYTSMLSDYYRAVISRWRLSNHQLSIETGRYTKPITELGDRVCTLCIVVEDEQHVIFDCPRYNNIRDQYRHLTVNHTITEFLQPTFAEMIDTASFLYAIETERNQLKL